MGVRGESFTPGLALGGGQGAPEDPAAGGRSDVV